MNLFTLGKQAGKQRIMKGYSGGHVIANRLHKALRQIRETKNRLEQKSWTHIPPGVEWLLDNVYLAFKEGEGAKEDLRRGRRLRKTEGKETYLSAAAYILVKNWGCCGTEELGNFLRGIQETGPLTEEELSLFIPAAKSALCIHLAEFCTALERDSECKELALRMEEVFTGLRTLAAANLGPILEAASCVDRILRQDPAGVYGKMSEATRARYRNQVCRLARKYRISEQDVAQRVLELAAQGQGNMRHVGWYLFRMPLGAHKKQPSGTIYVASILLPTLVLTLWIVFSLHNWILFPVLLLPVSDIAKNVVDFWSVRIVPPREIPRMALKNGIPREGRTLCVIAGLLTGEKSGEEYANLLEQYHLSNRDCGKELRFGLLADLPDRGTPMGAKEHQWVRAAEKAVSALNEKYGTGFYLFFRQPIFHQKDERYVGWERKRGALLELTRLLRGKPTSLRILVGKSDELLDTKYVITLDSDTSLNVGIARKLVGAMLHPLNRPQVSGDKIVTEGYGLLQPRVAVDLMAANRSQFSRIFAGQGGIDPYGGACSDVYHDLFNRGTYTGKGIFDVEVYLECLDGRFPQGRILSHDLIEGAYLHAGLLEDAELSDGYPYQVTSYFTRLHRWIRGDWQLLPWLCLHVKNEKGEQVANPISAVDKWKIFDNLRRSLSPIFTLAALLLGMCHSGPVFGISAGLAIISIWSGLLLAGADLAVRGGVGLRRRYHATIVAGFGGMLLQTLIQLLLLPYHAWICASAVFTALWRSFVTHKKMLEWVTAADTERKKDGLWGSFCNQWPAVGIGVFAMLFSVLPAGAAIGLIWAVSPCFSWLLSRSIQKENTWSREEHPFLLNQASLIWGYFRDWLREEDHWLPPDNVQEKPWLGPARRTSPTNIGMALLSCVAAVDLELTSRGTALRLIENMINTLEILPKWKGHLYNWYDTSTALPLSPQYISTVDSGNLKGCLIALGETLKAWKEDELAGRTETLASAMSLAPLYDKERKLFFIGFDVEKGEMTPGSYDLLASEARLASYIAVAMGEVDAQHWGRLGRGLVGENNYCGLASWTGTMFEYFMPNLLLPSEEGSMMYESLAFCIYAQKRRGAKAGVPWGISESGFYAFDPGMAYQYKAHGVQSLGLKRGLDQELVVAPYASFLALLLAPRSAERNLRRLRDMGLEGKYGLYESVDFTRSRLSEEEPWEAVCSFMAHHMGMSLIAIDNSLNQSIMQERFFRNRSMRAFRELLQEKVPIGAPIMKLDRQLPLERARPSRQHAFCRTGEGYDLARPACHLLNNSQLTVLCTDSGAVQLKRRDGCAPFVTRFEEQYEPSGVSFFFRETSGTLYSLGGAPLWEEGHFGWQFEGGEARWTIEEENFSAALRLTLPKYEVGARWTVELKGACQGELICYLEPMMAREADYFAHPAYSKLFIESKPIENGILFSRRPKSGKEKLALAVLWDKKADGLDTSREKALGRGGLRRLEQALEEPAKESIGAVLDPCLLARFSVGKEEHYQLKLAFGLENEGSRAIETARETLNGTTIASGGMEATLRRLQMSEREGVRAMELLSMLVYPNKSAHSFPQSSLWQYGVSGDLPIAAVLPKSEGTQEDPFLLKAHQLLRQCGFSFDLLYLLTDQGSYHRRQKSRLLEMLKGVGAENLLDQKGGIYLVDLASEDQLALWKDWANVLVSPEGLLQEKNVPKYSRLPACRLSAELPSWRFEPCEAFCLTLDGALPSLGWSHLLVNETFGWLTDETGCGHLWEGNARESVLTEWNNDPLAIGGPEWFFLRYAGEEKSIFADGDGSRVNITYGFGWCCWEKEWREGFIKTTGFIPWGRNERLILIELPGGEGELRHIKKGNGESLFRFSGELCVCTTAAGTQTAEAEEFRQLFEKTKAHWKRQCQSLTIKTPEPALDHYLNGWCRYQVIACRLLGRTSRYQNGGAFGFRDQLQDTLALLPFSPQRTKEQLLRCCAHQFLEGDVQHWWHEVGEEKNRGVRTRISDDLLWLPLVLARYVSTWGDWGFLEENASFLEGDPLEPHEMERYFAAQSSQNSASVYEHAIRAIRCVLKRGVGPHGLLKIGSGDWNDGMNQVGHQGEGESVWLTWFTVVVLTEFSELSKKKRDTDTQELCRTWGNKLREAAENAWDGNWYLRGWYDDGKILGGHDSGECQIDSIAQSWAVFAGCDREKGDRALTSALSMLFDQNAGIVKLFTPPFDSGEQEPGYIKGYLPGIRENGGQYTHGAVWLALACFEQGRQETGWTILRTLLPQLHPHEAYQAEPYVLAGDVYSHPQHLGRGGWSWYTGSAGWYGQAVIGALLGIKIRAGNLTIVPSIPASWPGWEGEWRGDGWTLKIRVTRGKAHGLRLDGASVDQIPLLRLSGMHLAELTLPEKT